MCDIWKGNNNTRQLNENDIRGLLESMDKLGVQKLVMSGGEALLHPDFFRFCEIIKTKGIRISLLSTGLLLRKYAKEVVSFVDDIVVSIDGDEVVHDAIRNVPGAFKKLSEGVSVIKFIDPAFRITSRTVIQQKNFRNWRAIVTAAKQAGIDQVSFLPADVSSHAFNREVLWSDQRKHEIMPGLDELPALKKEIEALIEIHHEDFTSHYIAEDPSKIARIYTYYAACYGLNPYPYKKCNAPWVSTVIEPDGSVKPCFFHPSYGNIREKSLPDILNSDSGIAFRKDLDTGNDPVCRKCVCYLHLSPGVKLD